MTIEKGRWIYVFENHTKAREFFKNLDNFYYENILKSADEKEEVDEQYWWPDNMYIVEYFKSDILERGFAGRISKQYYERIKNTKIKGVDKAYIFVIFPNFDTDPEPYGVLVD